MKATTATTTTKTTMCGVQSENNCKKCNYEKHDNSSSYSYDFNYNYKNNNNNNNNIQTSNKNNDYKNNYYKKKSHKYKQRNSRLGGTLNKKTLYKTTFDKTTTILTNIRKRRRITTEAASFNGISELNSTFKISPASSVNPSTSDSIASSATDALSGVLNLFLLNATLLTAAAISAATSAATTSTTTTLPTTTTDFYALFDDADSDATILRDAMNTTSEIKINIDIDNSNNSNSNSNSNSNNFSTTSVNDTRIEYIFDNNYVRILFIVLYTMCFCCCVFGNLLVILVVTCSRRLRSITNFFLANLAVADFCVGVFCVMQNLSIYLIDSWVFGEFLCRMYQFVHSLSYTASIFILVVICTERYFAIVHPITCKQILTAARLRMVIVTVWITAAVYSTPKFIFSKTIENIHEDGHKEEICVLDRKMYNSKLLDMISFVLLYAIPLMVMTVLYSKIAITLWRSSRGWSQHIAQQHDNGSGLHNNNMYQNQTQHHQQHNNHHQLQLQLQQQQKQHHPLTNSSSSSSSTPTTASMLSRKQSSTAAYEKRCVSITESQVSLESDRPVVSTCRSSKSSFYHHHNHHQVQHQPQPPHHHHLHQPRHGAQRAASHMSHSSSNVLRARRGVVRMLIIFVLTFAICNLPIHARKMWQYWGQSYRGDSNFNALLTPLTFLCSYFNSGVNPLLYAFLSRNFRKGMKELLMCSWKKSKNKSSSNSSMHHKRIALQTHSLPTDTTHIGSEQL